MTKFESGNSLFETTPYEVIVNVPELLERDANGEYIPVILRNTALGMYDIPAFSTITSDESTKIESQEYLEAIKQTSVKLSKAFQFAHQQFTEKIPGDKRYSLDSGIERLKAAGDEILFASNQGPLADILYALMLEAKHEELIRQSEKLQEVFTQSKGTPIPKMHFAFAYPYQYRHNETGVTRKGDEMTAQLVDIGGQTDILLSGELLDIKEFKDGNPETLVIASSPRSSDETAIEVVYSNDDQSVESIIGMLEEAGMRSAEIHGAAKMRQKLARPDLSYKRLVIPRGIAAQAILNNLVNTHYDIRQIVEVINEKMNESDPALPVEKGPNPSISPDLAASLLPRIDKDFALNPDKNPNEGDVG